MNFKYSILKRQSKKVKVRSQSAGNSIGGTSETLCNGIHSHENLKEISDHVPTHTKPLNDEQFGYYLAGLIDGDGHFSNQEQLVIVFEEKSVFLAYYIKERIGYGSVKKVKEKRAYVYVISSLKIVILVIRLINNKIRLKSKLLQINRILNNEKNLKLFSNLSFSLDETEDLNNHWLAGFSDADASFQIKILKRNDKTEVRLNFQVDQKVKYILDSIKFFLWEIIGYRQKNDTYYYGSTSFGSARKVIDYFDNFHLQSNKQINYLKWRKAYLLIQKKEHLTSNGIIKIRKIKESMNSKQ